jgi:hypothetical protein
MYVTCIESTVDQKGQRWLEPAEDYLSSMETGMKIIKDWFVLCISAFNRVGFITDE